MIKHILLAAFCCLSFSIAEAQPPAASPTPAAAADNRVPCQKTPTIPSFNITLVDSVTVFNTSAIKEGKKTAFVVFGPDCSHCRDFFAQLFIGIDTLKTIDFYLVTPIRSYSSFYNFYYQLNIEGHKNIKAAGRDLDFFSMDFFGVKQFPYIILYDEHRKLKSGFGPGPALQELHD